MRKFVILTDSCSDLNAELRTRYDIEYLAMRVIKDKIVDMPASLDWEFMPVADFYGNMRKGTRFTTAQITEYEYSQTFKKYAESGLDVLSISCSSALSGSFKASQRARNEVLAQFPDAKIVCIDSLNSCMGLGMLCITASEMRAEGKTIEEVRDWLEAHKLEMHQYAIADDLIYLRRAGRVSATSAVFGGMLKIKPVIISDAKGQNFANEKVKGRPAAFKRLLEHFKEDYVDGHEYQKIAISHADCLDEALKLKEKIIELMPDKNVEIYFNFIGPIIGASVGPGTLAIYFYGEKVTVNA